MSNNRLLQYLKKTTSGNAAPSTAYQVQLPKLVTFQNIYDLPLSRFINVVVDGNLHALVKSGVCVDPIILHNLWADIIKQYSETVGTAEYKLFKKLSAEVEELKDTYEAIDLALQLLQPGIYSKYFCDQLNYLLGGKYEFNYKNDKAYQKDLKGCRSRSKAIKMMFTMKQKNLDIIKAKQVDGVAPDRKYYNSILITLSDHAKFQIDDSVTVAVFCERLKRLYEYADHVNSLKNKKK